VEALVAEALQRRRDLPGSADVRVLRGHVLKEIRGLADQDPDFDWGRFHGIRPAAPLAGADPVVAETERRQWQNDELADRMRRLNALIDQRRRSLGLPTNEPGAGTPAQFDIEVVPLPDQGDYWSQRMRRTQEKIADARRRPAAEGEK
jgi:hypothetical protein